MQTLALAPLNVAYEAHAFVAVLRGSELIYEAANTAFCRLVGCDNLRGRGNAEVGPPVLAEAAEQVYMSGRAFIDHELAMTREGSRRYFDIAVTPLRAIDGSVDGVSIFAVDVTDHVEARRLAETMRAEAERRSGAKDEFLAIVSHELRNPLSAILGWAQFLRAESRGRTLDMALERIERNAAAQAKLLDELLDVPRITCGRVHLELREIDLRDLVHSVVESSQPASAAREIAVTFTCAPDLPAVLGDSARLSQVVWNLMTNAVKFAAHGGQVDVTLEEVGSGVRLSVTNDGEGIPIAFLERVFERFEQADPLASRARRGLGLGLWISRDIVALHGGTIHAQSAGVNRGATFVVTLPINTGVR